MQNLKYFYLLFIFLIFPSHSDLIYAQEPIKSASEYDYPPFSIVTEKGEADGFSVELLRASLKAVGLDVKFHVGPWAKIKQDLADGKIQVLPLVGRTPEREKIYDFSVPYKTNYGGIFVRKNQTSIKILKDLADKEVIVMKGDNAEEFLFRENISKHIITTESFEDAFKMLSQGKHDAVVAQQIVGRQLIEKLGITNVVHRSRIDKYKQDWTFAVKEGDKELLARLNDGLSIIIINGTFDIIHDKWFGKIKAKKKLETELTSKEKAFIASHPIIKLGIDDTWEPYAFRSKDGFLLGLTVDYTNLINEYAGTNIQIVTGDWNDIVTQAVNNSIDGLATSTNVPSREPYFFFSDPYITDYPVLVLPFDSSLVINELNDFSGKTIVFEKGHAIKQKITESIPQAKILISKSEEDSIKLMLEGKADAAFLTASTYHAHKRNFLSLIKMGYIGNDSPVNVVYSINRSLPELVPIINKTLRNIPQIKKDKIYTKWFGATTYLDEYETIELQEEKKESRPIIPMAWILGILILFILSLFILNKLDIVKFDKNAVILVLSIALLLIIGLFIFNTYSITENVKKSAIENYYNTLKAKASALHTNIEQHIIHMKSSFKVLSSRKTISNEDLMKIVELGEDFFDIFIINSDGKIIHSSDISHIGLSRLTDLYFKNTKEGLYIKPLYLSKTIEEVSFTISAPYNRGVLVARLNFNHIHELISKKEGLGKSGESLLAYRDENGDAVFFTERRFTAEAEARDIIPKEDINIPITQALLGNEKEFSDYVDYRGVPVFAVTKYIEDIDAGLVVKIDQEEALKSISENVNQIWYSTAVIILTIIIIGIIFYFLLTNTLRREIKNKTIELEKASVGLSEKVVLLQNSERKLLSAFKLNKNIISLSPVGILIYNSAGDCITANDTAAGMSGGTKAQVLLQNYHQIDSWKKSGLYDIALSSMQENTKKRQEIKIKTTFGKDCTLDIQLVPFSIENEPHLLIMFDDITDRKRAEEEKNQLETQLKQAQKMESIGTLTGGIAHDFNNILGIIVGNTELALDDVPKWNSAHASLKEIKKASLRAKNIVKHLLSFSRKTDQELQSIQITLVIKDALKFLRSTIPTTININQDIQTTDETILADPTQINQIIMNLCINASHAMEQTGGDLTVTVAKVILDNNSAKGYQDLKSGDYVKIMIRDTGPGIDPEIIDQIFDPYFTTKEVGKGSGMGLAIVHGIIKNHNGSIAVYSSLGKGTKFIMFFPLVKEKPVVEKKTTPDIPRGNETILFVDDEISITKMVKRMFERLGYKVETATTPQGALELFRLNPDHFDLVITDMTMPQMTGVKLSEKLMAIRKDIPIIVCTGHSAFVDEEKAKDLGLAAYIMKPIDMLGTAQTIRKILDKK